MKRILPLLYCLLATTSLQARNDIVIADFEGESYGDWKVEGDAFGSGPAHGNIGGQQPVTGFLGNGFANSFNGGDAATGKLTSSKFKIERPHINFYIGGGGFAGQTCINLLIEGKIVRTATGPNSKPGGSEALQQASWDVSEFIGKDALIEIVDQRTDFWGHITVDQIVQADPKPVIADFEGETYGNWKVEGDAFGSGPAHGGLPGQQNVIGFAGNGFANSYHNGDAGKGKLTSPPFRITLPFINFLIGGGGFPGQTCMNLLIEGKIVRTATGPNTKAGGSEALQPASWNVAEFIGNNAVIEIVDQRTDFWGHINVDQIVQSNSGEEIRTSAPLSRP